MRTYTQEELVNFGTYLLSKRRRKTINNKVNIDKVCDSDIANFETVTTD